MARFVADIDSPDNVEKMIEAMQVFLTTKTKNGVFHGTPGGPDFNSHPGLIASHEESGIIVHFESVEQFKEIHQAATLFEENHEMREVDEFNKQDNSFSAWPLIAMPFGDDQETWVVLVKVSSDMATKFPNVGETCHIRVVDPDTRIANSNSMWWMARRMSNNFATVDQSKKSWANLLVFNVTLSRTADDAQSVIQALLTNDDQQEQNLADLVLNHDNSVQIGFFFSKSSATFEAEMNSLGRLTRAAVIPAIANPRKFAVPQMLQASKSGQLVQVNPRSIQPKQFAAFRYLLDFRDPAFMVDMFYLVPHMQDPEQHAVEIPLAILNKYRRMDEHQREAYYGLLSEMPCGLGILPGGPGGGKTDWAMTVVGLLQSKTTAKVLYLLDINDPLDDATTKYIKMMKSAGLTKRSIRMRNFGTELKRSVRVGAARKFAQESSQDDANDPASPPDVDFSKTFLRMYVEKTTGSGFKINRNRDLILTLDEAAWDLYEKNLDDYTKLTEMLETEPGNVVENGAIRNEVFQVYQKALQEADFIAATPCVAATAFKKMFSPDLVIFDEAAHARELSTLIAIASFCPTIGWLFIGDHRQTQPTAKSGETNPHVQQLQTSAMERAHIAGTLKYELLINHRAYGRLERLPSKLIYGGQMVSGIPFADRFPPCAKYVRDYFETLSGVRCSVPRLIIHLLQVNGASRIGTSWYHQQHLEWTMTRVFELVANKEFRSTENMAKPGTILLLAPYKAAVRKYQEAIEVLAAAHPELDIIGRVEARTWDSCQGHEADIVGIDYVREHSTRFMDGMYRFNVGLTRARQGEWHLMHPDLPISHSFRYTQYLRKLYGACKYGLDGLSEGRVVSFRWVDFKLATMPAQALQALHRIASSPSTWFPCARPSPEVKPGIEAKVRSLILLGGERAASNSESSPAQ